jgi:hypothetical protein
MAFTTSQLKTQNTPTLDTENQLSAQELAFLLDGLKKTTFLGEQVEVVYNLIMKLQNQYIDQAK